MKRKNISPGARLFEHRYFYNPYRYTLPPECPECGGELSADAKECPHCGIALVKKELPPPEKLKKRTQILLYFVWIAFFIAYVVLYVLWQKGAFTM